MVKPLQLLPVEFDYPKIENEADIEAERLARLTLFSGDLDDFDWKKEYLMLLANLYGFGQQYFLNIENVIGIINDPVLYQKAVVIDSLLQDLVNEVEIVRYEIQKNELEELEETKEKEDSNG